MSCHVVGQTNLETALYDYIFEYFVAASVTRNGENMTVPCQSLVLLDDTLGNVQKADVRFGVGFLSSGDYPKIAVEEGLQAVGGEVLHVRIRQTREHGKDEQVPYKLVGGVLHRCVHERLYLRSGEVAPVHAFGRVDISGKGIERQTPVVPCNGNDVFQHNHVAPYRVGAAFLFRAQEILEIVDECQVQFFKGNIVPLVGVRKKFAEVFVNGFVALVCSLRPAVSDFLGKLAIVLLKEFQQGFLLDTDTEIGIFEFGGSDISVRLHQFLVAAVHLHPNLVNRTVDSLRFDTFARSTVVLHVPQAQGNIHLATELLNLSVHRNATHQRQVAVGFLTAFLHVE